MKKYIKWVFLVISIISLIITIILFVNFLEQNNNKKPSIKDNLGIMYDKYLIRKGIKIYENGELLGEDFDFKINHYIRFSNDYVEYCNDGIIDCDKYNYVYDNGNVNIFSEIFYKLDGIYEITIENNILILTQTRDNSKIINYFTISE